MGDILLFLPIKEQSHKVYQRMYDTAKYMIPNKNILHVAISENIEFYESYINEDIHIIENNHLDELVLKKYPSVDTIIFEEMDEELELFTYSVEITDNINIYKSKWLGLYGLHPVNLVNLTSNYELLDKQVFTRKAKHKNGLVYHPYGLTYYDNIFNDINEMGFRLEKNYLNFKNRKKNHKLIAIVGGSVAFGLFSPLPKTFGKRLEFMLNEKSRNEYTYTILNFAICGHMIIDEMTTYMLYIESLNPDIVIAHDGFNDLSHGQLSDTHLVKKYNYMYHHPLEEVASRVSSNFDKEINDNRFHLTNPSLVINAYYERKKQFERMVTNNNSIFISGFQPSLYSKKSLTTEERYLYNLSKRIGTINSINNRTKMTLMYKRYVEFEENNECFKFSINFDQKFSECDKNDELFGDIAHYNDGGEIKTAKEYYNLINEMIKKELI